VFGYDAVAVDVALLSDPLTLLELVTKSRQEKILLPTKGWFFLSDILLSNPASFHNLMVSCSG
jgi:hypothetical protein